MTKKEIIDILKTLIDEIDLDIITYKEIIEKLELIKNALRDIENRQ